MDRYPKLSLLILAWLAGLILPSQALHVPRRDRQWFLSSPVRLIESNYAQLNHTDLEPLHFKEYGAKRVLMRYGPYTVPSSKEAHGMKEFNDQAAEKPCTDCYITGLRAGLEYPNGTVANTNTGMWLHHAVLYDFGRQDLACATMPYRFFASGNERSRLDLSINGQSKTGFPLLDSSNMGITIELMNEYAEERDAILTLEFEYVPTLRKDFGPVDALWLDITGVCGESEADVPKNTTTFEFHTPDVMIKTSGKILAAGGHLHDGGTLCRITKNSKKLCDFIPTYGLLPEYIDNIPMQMPDMAGLGYIPHKQSAVRKHISKMPLCYLPGDYSPGDKFGLISYYDLNAYEPMIGSKGGLEPVMGISIIYLVNDNAPDPKGAASTSKTIISQVTPTITSALTIVTGGITQTVSQDPNTGGMGNKDTSTGTGPSTITSNSIIPNPNLEQPAPTIISVPAGPPGVITVIITTNVPTVYSTVYTTYTAVFTSTVMITSTLVSTISSASALPTNPFGWEFLPNPFGQQTALSNTASTTSTRPQPAPTFDPAYTFTPRPSSTSNPANSANSSSGWGPPGWDMGQPGAQPSKTTSSAPWDSGSAWDMGKPNPPTWTTSTWGGQAFQSSNVNAPHTHTSSSSHKSSKPSSRRTSRSTTTRITIGPYLTLNIPIYTLSPNNNNKQNKGNQKGGNNNNKGSKNRPFGFSYSRRFCIANGPCLPADDPRAEI
ncbi:hypothetical protein BT63DRAFT_46045 [Microthyrium microscopicum]|uniref:Peptidase A1 domain-containing protein n=1 Tax=Microthyrium microscopicum TaxID=703497 RepID=A0A6A6U2U7_9PEZI|nr:hypothetical protein BT63DRAFT_46045 [Microthyrium microscopicum]